MKRRKNNKKKSPSRDRYEKNNPVTSFRLSKEDGDYSLAMRKKEGMSHADVYKVGLGLIKVKIRSEDEIRKEAHDKAEVEGFEFSESIFKVTYPCSVCRKPIELDTPEEKKAAARYMTEHGWAHGECHEQRR